MEERGFIRDMLDVKVLILFVAAKAKYPLTLQKIYELCYQDDRLSYFDVSIAVPQMVESGHLAVSYTHLDVYKRQPNSLIKSDGGNGPMKSGNLLFARCQFRRSDRKMRECRFRALCKTAKCIFFFPDNERRTNR